MSARPELVVSSVTGIDVVLPIAGPGVRSYAFLIDWHIRTILTVGWYVVAAVIYNRAWNISAPLTPNAAWFVYVIAPPAAIYTLYHILLETLTRGATPGKRMAGIQIVTRTGNAPTAGALLARNVFRLIDSFPVAYAVGLVTTMLTRTHVRIGDLAAGTVLVYARSDLDPAGSDDSVRNAAQRVKRLAAHRANDATDAVALVEDYRMLAAQAGKARRSGTYTRAGEYLDATYARVHTSLYRPAWHPGHALLTLFRDEVPAVVHELRPHIAWATALFILTVAVGYLMVHAYPDLIALFASPELIATVERGQLWTEGLLNVVPSSVLSVQILTNNIVVSLFAYCAGFLFGLGTLYIVGLNGLMLGAVFAFTSLHGLGDDLFAFVVAHGCVEISVMCLSGAAGAAVGEALVRPGADGRAASFQRAALRSGKLILACVVLLIGSGLIEGYISPDPRFPFWSRIAIGLGYWMLMLALLTGWLFGPVTRGARATRGVHA